MTTYLLVGLAVVAAVFFVLKVAGRGTAMVVIQAPSLGVLNLAGPAGDALVAQDLTVISPLFGTTRKSDGAPPTCDVLLLYCEIAPNGVVKGADRGLRELIRDAGASVVVVAMNHPVDAYIAAAPRVPFGRANLVMTLDRKGTALPTFLARLFERMNAGTSMPVAWNELAPQILGVSHGDAPETIFACERGQLAFGQRMKHFRVSLRGENVLLTFDGQPTRMGFYTTRFVQANNPEGAELLAVDLIRSDKRLRGAANLRSDPPMISADEIDEVASEDVPEITAGFTFFPSDGSDA